MGNSEQQPALDASAVLQVKRLCWVSLDEVLFNRGMVINPLIGIYKLYGYEYGIL